MTSISQATFALAVVLALTSGGFAAGFAVGAAIVVFLFEVFLFVRAGLEP